MSNPLHRGLPWLQVTVSSIDGRLADVVDAFGEHKTVRIDILRAKGPRPEVGESWIIDRALGFWTFAANLDVKPPPVVSGSRGDGSALANLLGVLADSGVIVDETTP